MTKEPMTNLRPAYSWLVAALLPLFAMITALTVPIEEHAYDAASFHVYRSVVFSDALADGGLYPRWVMPINGGLGGPLFSFYSPAVYYGLDALHRIGFSQPIAWRIMVALALEIAALGMFGFVLALLHRADLALVAAACFTYAPYLLRDFFERGGPQGIAVALCPWLLWALLRLARNPTGLRLLIAAVCWTAIILMHNLTGLMVLPIAGIFSLYLAARFGIRVLALPISVMILGILLAAFHVVPFLSDAKYIQLESASRDFYTQPAENPVALGDLLAPVVVFDTALDNNFTGYTIGLLYALILILGIPITVSLWRQKRSADALLVGALTLFGLFAVWMQSDLASFVWRAISLLSILQFRTRLLTMIGLVAAIIVAHWLDNLPARFQASRPLLISVLVAGCFVTQFPSMYPQLLHRYMTFSASPTVAEAQAWAIANHVPGLTLTTTKELIPRWRLNIFTDDEVRKIAAGPIDNLPEGSRVAAEERRTGYLKIVVEARESFQAALHLLYYPGWTAAINGTPQQIQPMEASGYTLINVPAGNNTIEMRYEGTPAEHLGDLISLIAAIGLVGSVLVWRRSAPLTPALSPTKVEGKGAIANHAEGQAVYLTARRWIPVLIVLLAIFKAVWIDPQTTLFRAASTCDAVQGADQQAQVDFEGQIRLCGYSISSTTIRPGDTIRVRLYWQMSRPMDKPIYSFVHVLGSAFNPATNNPLWGQRDNQIPGGLPTTYWLAGPLYQDVSDIQIVPGAPPGDYQLEVGWYTPEGTRLKPTILLPSARLTVSDLDALNISGIIIR